MPQQRAQRARDDYQLTYDVKFLVVVLLLVFAYPVGVILMWVWMPWPTWVKILLSLPVLLFLFALFLGMVFFTSLWRLGGMNSWRNSTPMMRNYYYYNQNGRYRMPMMQPENPSPTSQTEQPTDTPLPSITTVPGTTY